MSRSPGTRGSGTPGQPVDRNPGAAERIPFDPRADSWRLRLTGSAYLAAWELARRVPEPVAFAVGEALGALAHRVGGDARARVRRNLARVVPAEHLDEVVAAAFRSYARYWVEAFRAADAPEESVDRRTTTEGFAHLDAVLDEGRGAVVLLAHHGSWDMAARWAESHRYHLAVVAEVVRPRVLFERFVASRETIGLEVVPLRRGQGLVGRLTEVLAENHLVGLLTDRDLSGTAPVVRMFGEDCRIPTGAVVLSQRTGAPIVPATMLQQPGRRWHLHVRPPLDVSGLSVAEGCQAVAGELEELIRLDPAQWHAFSPVFLADLPPHRRGDWAPATSASGEEGAP